jgi:hypothetical protein
MFNRRAPLLIGVSNEISRESSHELPNVNSTICGWRLRLAKAETRARMYVLRGAPASLPERRLESNSATNVPAAF